MIAARSVFGTLDADGYFRQTICIFDLMSKLIKHAYEDLKAIVV